jgi:hypothetical protein
VTLGGSWESGAELAVSRERRGISLEQAAAATRIRRHHLEALEKGELAAIPAETYLRGYLRTYSAYLGLDPQPFLASLPARPAYGPAQLSIGPYSPRAPGRLAVSRPLLTGLGLLAVAILVGGYMVRQLDSVRGAAPTVAAPASIPIASAPPLGVEATPARSAPPAAAPAASGVTASQLMSVIVNVTEEVWLYVEVDGKPFYGDSGRFLPAGGEAIFIGQKIKITSGKGAATLVIVDGKEIGKLGSGVVSREFSAQT